MLVREPVPATPRRAMTPARKLRIEARDGRRCRVADCAATDPLEVDHILALELSGPDTDENCQLLCVPHHKAKTKIDKAKIGKMRRRQRDNDPVRRAERQAKKRQIPGRPCGPSAGFQTNPTMKRCLDGKVRARVQKEKR